MGKVVKLNTKNTLDKGLRKYFKLAGVSKNKSSGADLLAKTKIGLQFINFIINGSPSEGVVPPVFQGILRASGSVHVGSKFVGGNNLMGQGAGLGATSLSNRTFNGKSSVVTIGFNTSYAVRMHETDWEPGPVSKQSGDVGNKFVEKHIAADGRTMIKMYSLIFKKETRG